MTSVLQVHSFRLYQYSKTLASTIVAPVDLDKPRPQLNCIEASVCLLLVIVALIKTAACIAVKTIGKDFLPSIGVKRTDVLAMGLTKPRTLMMYRSGL